MKTDWQSIAEFCEETGIEKYKVYRAIKAGKEKDLGFKYKQIGSVKLVKRIKEAV